MRNVVLFAHVLMPLMVGREKSIAAVEARDARWCRAW
jgi:hypothetical protein